MGHLLRIRRHFRTGAITHGRVFSQPVLRPYDCYSDIVVAEEKRDSRRGEGAYRRERTFV